MSYEWADPVVGELRGPFPVNYATSRKDGVTFIVYAPDGWVYVPGPARDEAELRQRAEAYAATLRTPAS